MNNAPNINSLWCGLLVEELVRNNIVYFCLSPGSRSTPLAVAVARNTQAQHIVCIDERAAAFHALGYARATGKPAVLMCTSGTAVANYLPAVVEAATDCVPMLILSADRPPELRHTGANQTIQQPSVFGAYTRWEFDMPCPDEHIPPQMPLTTMDYAAWRATAPVAGPVHINCMFREPLAPVEHRHEHVQKYAQTIQHWLHNTEPYTRYEQPITLASSATIERVAECLTSAQKPLLVVGKLRSTEESNAVATLAEKLGIPVCADITSGLRLGVSETCILPFADQMLLSLQAAEVLQPDAVLYIGEQLVSKRLQQFLEAQRDIPFITVKPHPFRHDPGHIVTQHIQADIAPFCEAVAQAAPAQHKLLASVQKFSQDIEQCVTAWIEQQQNISEIAVAHIISSALPADCGLFLSNSMPVRDMDMYASSRGARVRIAANRGASGIDGIVASACGFAIGLAAPVTLLIGDLALLHDLNSLVLAAANAQPLVIVVVNNSGGGIFSFLPIAQHSDVFEPYFAAPQAVNIEHAARTAGIPHYAPTTNKEFAHVYSTAVQSRSTTLIEVQTNREHNVQQHRELQAKIVAWMEKAAHDNQGVKE